MRRGLAGGSTPCVYAWALVCYGSELCGLGMCVYMECVLWGAAVAVCLFDSGLSVGFVAWLLRAELLLHWCLLVDRYQGCVDAVHAAQGHEHAASQGHEHASACGNLLTYSPVGAELSLLGKHAGRSSVATWMHPSCHCCCWSYMPVLHLA